METFIEWLAEVAPPGWSGTVAAMKQKHPEIDNPYALAWSMKKKHDKPHYKEQPNKDSRNKKKPVKKEKYKDEDREDVYEGKFWPTVAMAGMSMLPSMGRGGEPQQAPAANADRPAAVNTNLPDSYYSTVRGLGSGSIFSPTYQGKIKDQYVRSDILKFMDWKNKMGGELVRPIQVTPQLLQQYPEAEKLPHEVRGYYIGLAQQNPRVRSQVQTGTWRETPQSIMRTLKGINGEIPSDDDSIEAQRYRDVQNVRKDVEGMPKAKPSPEQTQGLRSMIDRLTQ